MSISQKKYSDRQIIIIVVFLIIGIIFISRLFYMQVIDTSYTISAENNSRRVVTKFPARGLIFDRNNKLLVYNEAAYDLMVVPRRLKDFDTLKLCKILDIDKKHVKKGLVKAKNYSSYLPSIFLKQISSQQYAILQELLYQFPGFFVQTRTLRNYPERTAAHILGYVGEVNNRIIKKYSYYKSGDYIGIKGIENSYEKQLRGEKGKEILLVDVHNRAVGSYKNGEYDTSAIAGYNLITTLDAKLQKYGEKLMQNKRGSIVAIEPATGEILSILSTPNYDPNLLVGRVRTKNYRKLLKDTLNPLFNRALMAKYPPGSTFKLVNALIGLQEGVITTNSVFSCNHGYRVGNFHLGCHHGGGINFKFSIQGSCNAYYCNVFRKILDNKKYKNTTGGYNAWRKHVLSFGLGQRLDSDLPRALKGFVPEDRYFNRYYGKNRWTSLMLVSMSIGQGELGVTPFQMANMTAIIANKGFYYTPHIVKKIINRHKELKPEVKKYNTTIDTKYFPPVIEGMEAVVTGGTATSAHLKGLTICGKTGTAENPHGKDHSIFVAFAPKDNPKIAIAVYVENGGYGSIWAAPIASLMIEKYLNDTISRPFLEQKMFKGNLMNVK